MKQVQDLIIGTSYDTTLTLANFATKAVGAINIIDPETGSSWATGGNSFVVARVCQDSDLRYYVRQSLPIGTGLIRNHVAKEYAAATAKTMTITIPATVPVAGDVYEFFVTDYNDAQFITGRRRIAYEAVATDLDNEDIADGLVAQLNSDESMPNLSAANVLGVITVTGEAVAGSNNIIAGFRAAHEVLFNIALAENMAGVSVVAAGNPAAKGCGTNREIKRLEETYKGYRGFTNRVWNSATISNIQYDTSTGDDYDVNTIQHKAYQHTNNEGNVNPVVSTIIALEESVAVLPGILGSFHFDLRAATDELK